MNHQQTGDMPTITGSSYTTSNWAGVIDGHDQPGNFGRLQQIRAVAQNWRPGQIIPLALPEQQQPNILLYNAGEAPTMTKRIVRVYLADTDDNVPLAQSLLFSSEEKFTDLTDQELYFEIPIKEVLDKHNALRGTIVNRKATERIGKEIFLDPVKIRDLKMTVVSIATF